MAEEPGGPALDEWRVREQRYGYGLQGEADPEFFHHVRLGLVVEISLHGAGAQHHVEPEPALFRHVIAHDPISLFRHPRDILAAPFWIEAEAEHTEPQLVTNLAHLAQMFKHLVASLMQGFERRPAQLELPAGLEGDRTSSVVGESNRVAILDDGLPS